MAPKKKKAAKGIGIDFKKVKHKVGRKLAPPQNATKTEFKAKAILLSDQSVARDKDGLAVNQRKKTLKELYNQLTHYNDRVRKDALLGMKDLFARHPKELELHGITAVQKLSARFTDVDKSVRHALLVLFRSIFPSLSKAVMGPVIPIVMAQLAGAMTHLSTDIRLSAFNFLDLLLQYFPYFLVSSSTSQIVQYYIHFLSDGSSTSGTVLSVLTSLERFLAIPGNNSRSSQHLSSVSTRKWSAKYAADKKLQGFQDEVKALHSYKSSMPESCIVHGGDLLDGDRMVLCTSLVQVLLNCWASISPTVCSSPMPDQIGLDSMVSITKSLCLILEWLAVPSASVVTGAIIREKVMPLCARHLMSAFPIAAPMVQVSQKVEEGLAALNVGICEVMLHFLSPSDDSKYLSSIAIVLEYYESALRGVLLPSFESSFVTESRQSEGHVKSLIAFIPRAIECAGDDWKPQLLQAFTTVFETCNAQSSIKLACLSASKSLLTERQNSVFVPENFSRKWLKEFPRLLWELKHNHPSSSKNVLEMMLHLGKFATVGSKLASEYAMLQPVMIPFFYTMMKTKKGNDKHIYGPFVKLPNDCQEIAVDLLYYLGRLELPFLKAISYCCFSSDVDVEIAIRVIELIRASYAAGNTGAGEYLSFLLAILTGGDSLGDNRKYNIMIGAVCSCLSQLGDGNLVLQLLGDALRECLMSCTPVVMSGILRVVCTLSCPYGMRAESHLPSSLADLPAKAAEYLASSPQEKSVRYAIVLMLRNKSFGQSLLKQLNNLLQQCGEDRVHCIAKLAIQMCKVDAFAKQYSSSDFDGLLKICGEMKDDSTVNQKEMRKLHIELETAVRAAFGWHKAAT